MAKTAQELYIDWEVTKRLAEGEAELLGKMRLELAAQEKKAKEYADNADRFYIEYMEARRAEGGKRG